MALWQLLVLSGLVGLVSANTPSATTTPAEPPRLTNTRWTKWPLAFGRLAPSKRDKYLVEFHGVDCDHCDEMVPLMDKLEKELKVKFKRILVWQGTQEFDLLQFLDIDVGCGGLPVFFNRQTQQAICGATSYRNLKNWAKGRPSMTFYPPPPKPLAKDGEEPVKVQKKKGFLGRLRDVKEQGQGKMTKRSAQKGTAEETEAQAEAEDDAQSQEEEEEAAQAAPAKKAPQRAKAGAKTRRRQDAFSFWLR